MMPTDQEAMRDSTLAITLSAAVPLCIEDMKHFSWEERKRMATEAAQIVAEHGDNILYKGHKPGDTAKALNALARALAICSFAPGGVTAFGLHFESVEDEH